MKWRVYKKARRHVKEQMAEEDPLLRQTERAVTKAREIRKTNHAATDAFAFRWQYSDKLRHPDNIGLGPEVIERTPVRFEPVGAGR